MSQMIVFFGKKKIQPLACWVYLAPAYWHLRVHFFFAKETAGVNFGKVQPG